MGTYAGYLVETFVTLLAVCGLAFVVLYGARRLGVGRPRGPIQLVGQLPLDARRAIYLVQVGDQVLVVGASEAGLTRIGEVSANHLPATQTPDSAPFTDVLARVLGNPKPTPTPTPKSTPTSTPPKPTSTSPPPPPPASNATTTATALSSPSSTSAPPPSAPPPPPPAPSSPAPAAPPVLVLPAPPASPAPLASATPPLHPTPPETPLG